MKAAGLSVATVTRAAALADPGKGPKATVGDLQKGAEGFNLSDNIALRDLDSEFEQMAFSGLTGGMQSAGEVSSSMGHMEPSSGPMAPRTARIPVMGPGFGDLENLFSNDLISAEIVTHCDVLTVGRVRRVSKPCDRMMTRIGSGRLRFYGCRKWLTINYGDFCQEATSVLAHEMTRKGSQDRSLGSPDFER
jgi:hypothetical protein